MGNVDFEHRIEHGMLVRSVGPEDGRVLVWIHGLGDSGQTFDRAIGELTGFRHRVPDLPSYGRSPWLDRPLRLEQHADHLAAWLAGFDGPPVLLGHSMGGVIATLLAERHPARVASVINIDGNQSAGDCTFSTPAAQLSLEEFLATGFDRLREKIYRAGVRTVALRGYHAGLRFCDPKAFHLNSVQLVELSAAEQLARRLVDTGIASLYIAGHPDGASARSLELLEAAGVETVEIAPAGHWPFVDQPGDFARCVERFEARKKKV